ncbi:hypothetical protein [Paraflavitalea sp. CAU 1676]|uniref:hypothetical protein n=1 Tax=Paraflavitalea sp. CAU 1676 TaxID=3032598 RepID=UPI0023DA232E|nr:hypothetical protein [Paraflavitalea sp. CAU 1676]MDF2188323.1 hypothetical protein [Paraflavitalea sp. CAU 1676]
MKDFIKALYVDLLHRIDIVVADINGRSIHPDIRNRFIAETNKQFSDIRDEIISTINGGDLDLPQMEGNNLYKFNGLYRTFMAIHSYRYLAIRNYDDPEIFFFKLISKIYSEHRISAIPPIVSTISNHDSYYWAVPYFEIIALPCGEEYSLLNLPDMYHEIGHLLHSMFQGKSCEISSGVIEQHFDRELVRIQDEGLGAHYADAIDEAKYLWKESWLEEFSCDLVGAYMTGAAYGWTNLKLLSTGRGFGKIYERNESHPADEARMRLIICMLDKLGLHQEKAEIELAWQIFLQETHPQVPKEHALLYPDYLLQHVIDEFFAFYQNADLVSYPELAQAGHLSVAQVLNKGWRQAQTNSANYYKYETDAINELRIDFGLKEI